MKFQVMFKTPDALDYALDQESCEDTREAMKSVASKFVRYGECVTIEFDTETNSAIVIPIDT